jgi:hypothetical protein
MKINIHFNIWLLIVFMIETGCVLCKVQAVLNTSEKNSHLMDIFILALSFWLWL